MLKKIISSTVSCNCLQFFPNFLLDKNEYCLFIVVVKYNNIVIIYIYRHTHTHTHLKEEVEISVIFLNPYLFHCFLWDIVFDLCPHLQEHNCCVNQGLAVFCSDFLK